LTSSGVISKVRGENDTVSIGMAKKKRRLRQQTPHLSDKRKKRGPDGVEKR